jgi:hypothetical protein
MYRPFLLSRTICTLLTAVAFGVSLTPVQAQSDDVARAIYISGRVSVWRGGELALSVNDAVRTKEIVLTGPDGYAQFRINDGSTFEAFHDSRVTFRDSFNPMDVLQLWLGKIRVMIDHHNGPNPRKVSTPTAVISVRGTVFDVTVEDDDGTTLVAVEEGLVSVKHQLQAGEDKYLKAGEAIRIFANQPLAKAPANSQGMQELYNKIKQAVADAIWSRPGAGGGGVPVGAGGGTAGGTTGGGANGDAGKKKGTGPGGAPGGG